MRELPHAVSAWFGVHPAAQELVITSIKVLVIQQVLLLVYLAVVVAATGALFRRRDVLV